MIRTERGLDMFVQPAKNDTPTSMVEWETKSLF